MPGMSSQTQRLHCRVLKGPLMGIFSFLFGGRQGSSTKSSVPVVPRGASSGRNGPVNHLIRGSRSNGGRNSSKGNRR